jgi:hypothetical protein
MLVRPNDSEMSSRCAAARAGAQRGERENFSHLGKFLGLFNGLQAARCAISSPPAQRDRYEWRLRGFRVGPERACVRARVRARARAWVSAHARAWRARAQLIPRSRILKNTRMRPGAFRVKSSAATHPLDARVLVSPGFNPVPFFASHGLETRDTRVVAPSFRSLGLFRTAGLKWA